ESPQPAAEPEAAEAGVAPPEPDLIAAVIEYADDPEASPPGNGHSASHWLITGRGFRPLAPKPPEAGMPVVERAESLDEPVPEAATGPFDNPLPVAGAAIEVPLAAEEDRLPPALDQVDDPEIAERVTRYNFEELGRILTDRVASEPNPEIPVV